MGESDSTVAKLTVPEINLFLLLDAAGVILTRPEGSIRWALNAEDVCDLLELAVDLIADWCGENASAMTVRARAASLLGADGDR